MVSLACLKKRGLEDRGFALAYYLWFRINEKRRGPHHRAAFSRGRFCLALAAAFFGPALAFGAAASVTADHQAGCCEPEGGEHPEGREAPGPVKCSLRHVARRVVQAPRVPVVAVRPPPGVAVGPPPVGAVPRPIAGVIRSPRAGVVLEPPGPVGAPFAPPAIIPRPRAAAGIAGITGRRGLVNRLVALDFLLWAELDRRADVLKVEVELVGKVGNIYDIRALAFTVIVVVVVIPLVVLVVRRFLSIALLDLSALRELIPVGGLYYYVHLGLGVSGVGHRLQRNALVGVVT